MLDGLERLHRHVAGADPTGPRLRHRPLLRAAGLRPPRHGDARGRRGLRRRRRLPRGVPCTLEDPQTELVVPAVQGTLNVLAAAKMYGVRRVVLTSSISALVPNPNWPRDKVFDESSWTDLEYCKSRQVFSFSIAFSSHYMCMYKHTYNLGLKMEPNARILFGSLKTRFATSINVSFYTFMRSVLFKLV